MKTRNHAGLSGSFIMLALLLVGAWAQRVAAAARLTDWRYRTTAKPAAERWADPDFTKLKDGDLSLDQSAIFSSSPLRLDIDLSAPARIQRLVIHTHRHNNNYKLRKITVLSTQAGRTSECAADRAGYWGPTEQSAFVHEINLDTVTDRLSLVFETGGILSLQEIEVFGEAAAEPSGGLEYTLPLQTAPGASAREIDADSDGAPELVLENAFVRLVFEPEGGVCRSFLIKASQTELAGGPARYGLLRDQLWSPSYMFGQRRYFTSFGTEPGLAWLELRAEGVGGMMSFTSVTKRVELKTGTPVVRVHYRLANDPNSQTDYQYGFWIHNFLGDRNAAGTYYFPTTAGVQSQDHDAEHRYEFWHYNPARGWAAYTSRTGIGIAATMDYKVLNCFYMWSGTGTPVPTLEWRYNGLPVACGDSFETSVTLIPFTALDRVDGVVDETVGGIAFAPAAAAGQQAVTLTLAQPAGTAPSTAKLRWREWPDGDWHVLAEQTFQGETLTLTAAVPIAPGTRVVGCELTRDGQVLGAFERPISIGKDAPEYRLEPESERIGVTGAEPEQTTAYPRHDLSTDIETPHVKWAKPYANGAIRALVLCDDRYSREVIELWQRLELDFEYVKFYTTLDNEWIYHGDRSIATLAAAQRRLTEVLENDFDVIILAALKWDHHFTPALRQSIAAKIKAGTGLVYIQPDGLTTDDEIEGVCGLPEGEKRSPWTWGAWQQTAAHYVSSGLPWDLFPRTREMPFAEPPRGTVLAEFIGNQPQPLLVAGELGRGRVLTFTYNTLTHAPSYRGYSALTPAISYRGEYLLGDEMARTTWDYWEHWWALLCRSAVWAARKDSGIRFEELNADVQAGTFTGRVLGAVPAGTEVEVVFRDRFSQEIARRRIGLTAVAEQTLQVPLPEAPRAGQAFADVFLRNATGAALAWAVAAYDPGPQPAFAGVEVDKRTVTDTTALWSAAQPWLQRFRPNTALQLRCAVEAPEPRPAELAVTARLLDCHGRLVFRETRPLTPEPAALTFQAQPAVLYNIGHRWQVTLHAGDRVFDTGRADLIVVPPREFDRFTFTSWNGQFLWRCQYLFDSVRPLVEQLGLDVAMNGDVELGTGKVWWDYWQNVEHSYLGVLNYVSKDVPDFGDRRFAEKATKYAATKDKAWLVREPSLADPEYRRKLRQALLENKLVNVSEFGRAYDYCMGDEMSLTHYTRYFDFDFSAASLNAFRDWLQRRYPDLAALNTAWETEYATWTDVMPMTLDEVRGRENAAPWAEFRDFMNDTLADYFGMVQAAIRTFDPAAHCGLSGTQEPKPGNGMDWWQNSQAFSYYHSYNTGWSDEMRRSFQPYTGVRTSPYRCGYWQSGQALEYQMFWCLLHDTKGISAWTTPLFFYGDLTYSEAGRDTRANVTELKAGLWDLIRSAERMHDGIAIHYSHPSINAALLLDKDREIVQVRDAWVKIIEDLGLQYNFVSYAQIEQGLLTNPPGPNEQYRVLVLPESIALSAKEVAEIEAFVRGGGAVIGDLAVGLMDARCRVQSQGMLDHVFGIARSGAEQAVPVGIVMNDGDLSLRLPVGETSVRGTTATARAHVPETEIPALLTNRFGAGHGIYLNLNLAEFENERRFGSPTETAVRKLMLETFATCGVRPAHPVSYKSGKAPHVEVIRYRSGPVQYLGLLRTQADEDQEVVSVRLEGRPHVYDLRSRQYLGALQDDLVTPMQPGDCMIYCLAPAELGRIVLEQPALGEHRRVGFRLQPNPATPGETQAVRVTVLRPDGVEVPDYAQNVILGADALDCFFQPALNEPAGTWTIRATPLCGGTAAAAETTVELPATRPAASARHR